MGVENFLEVSAVGRSAQGIRFQTPAGQTLWGKNESYSAEGAPATLAVGPEAVRLSVAPPNPEPLNLLVGEVVEAIYEGISRRWSVRLASGEHLIVRESNTQNSLPHDAAPRGGKVYLSWEPE